MHIQKRLIKKQLIAVTLLLTLAACSSTALTSLPKNFLSKVSTRTQSIEGYVFTLKGCTLSNKIVECELSVVQERKDGKVELRTEWGAIFDNAGTKFVSDWISIGNKKGERSVRHRLIRGIPLNVHVSFFVSPETSSIALLEMKGWVGTSAINNGLRFRNIAFQ